jgi:hypothetical protein
MKKLPKDLNGCRVQIAADSHTGHEGVCLGRAADGKKWSVLSNDPNEILSLTFDKVFGLLLDMSRDPQRI